MQFARLVPAIALLVVLAGCAGAPTGTPTDAGTTEPAGETPTDSPTPTGTSTPAVSFPDGTSADGITDGRALVETSTQSLVGTAFRYEFTRTSNGSDGAYPPLNQTFHVGYENGTEVNYMVKRGAAHLAPVEVYAEGPTLYRRFLDPGPNTSNGYRFGVARADGDADPVIRLFGPSASLPRVLDAGTWSFEGTTTRDGTTLLRYEATGTDADGYVDVTGTLLVAESGTVRSLSATYVRAANGTHVEYALDYRVETDVDAPPKPDWVDDVPRFSLAEVENDTVFALTHEGGDAVPAGTNVSAYAVGDVRLEERTPSLPTRVEPGESVYLYAVETDEGPAFRISESPPDRDDLVALSGGEVGVYAVGDVRLRMSVSTRNASA